jgi:DNA invertase Pin-like site-specific DNA recombinase
MPVFVRRDSRVAPDTEMGRHQLLEEYAERHNLMPYIHIQDDGYSGTNWNRPGWQELIAKVEADEVNCICII